MSLLKQSIYISMVFALKYVYVFVSREARPMGSLEHRSQKSINSAITLQKYIVNNRRAFDECIIKGISYTLARLIRKNMFAEKKKNKLLVVST